MKHPLLSSLAPGSRCLRSVIVVASLCWAIVPALAQVDNFNDGNDTGWVRLDPIHDALEYYFPPPQPAFATWSLPDGGYRLQSTSSPDAGTLGPSRAGSYWTNAAYTYTNFYVSVDVRPWGIITNQAVGILGRIQDYSLYGATYAYTLTYEPYVQDFQITAFIGDRFTQLVVQKVDLAPTNSHRLVFVGNGEALEGRIYALPDVLNPVATISTTDTTYSGGWCGVLVFSLNNYATDATYDNYVALPEPPPVLSITRAGNEVSVSWPAGQASYTLQYSPVLPPLSWTPITTGITSVGGNYIYKTVPSETTFYRLQLN